MGILIITQNCSLFTRAFKGLQKTSCKITFCDSFEKALQIKLILSHNIIVIDIENHLLEDQLKITKEIRAIKKMTPILIISPNKCLTTKVRFLNAGADDYIHKPLHKAEIAAKIYALNRAYQEFPQLNVETHRNITFDWNRNIIHIKQTQIKLTTKEKEVLLALLRNQETVTSKEHLLKKIWNIRYGYHSNILESTIKRLRKKLKSASSKIKIISIRGIGYTLWIKD